MREPYETLFAPYRDHRLLGGFLTGDTPDWPGLMDNPKLDSLSSGEITLLWVGLAIWNGDRTARVADLAALDLETRRRVLDALYLTCRV